MGTVRSIASRARARRGSTATPAPRTGTWAASGAPADDQVAAAAPGDAMLTSVPADVIALYTSVLGVLTGIVTINPVNGYLPLRWWLYGGCIVAILLVVPLSYYLAPGGRPAAGRPTVLPHPERPGEKLSAGAPPPGGAPPPAQENPAKWPFPLSDTVIPAFSFAVWGLIVPGSPLYLILKSPTLPVVVAVLTATGAFLTTSVFDPLLAREAKERQ